MPTDDFHDILDHIKIHNRNDDRATPNSGKVVYVRNDQLVTVDTNGNIQKPLEVAKSDTTGSLSPGFGSWSTADANRPTWLELDVTVETDGTSRGEIVVDVDEDGGTTADYTFTIAHIAPDNSAGTQDKGYAKVYIPAGAQYQIRNVSDPNGNNATGDVRLVTA